MLEEKKELKRILRMLSTTLCISITGMSFTRAEQKHIDAFLSDPVQ
jgi:hypothetical protein